MLLLFLPEFSTGEESSQPIANMYMYMCYIEMCFRVTMLGQYQINKQTNKQTKHAKKFGINIFDYEGNDI